MARLIYPTSKFEHVSRLFLNLHWLPVEQRIIFKIALVSFKALHDFVPSNIKELIRPYRPDRALIIIIITTTTTTSSCGLRCPPPEVVGLVGTCEGGIVIPCRSSNAYVP